MIVGFALLFGCQLAGELLSRTAALPLPGPVAGMVLLLALLALRPALAAHVRGVAHGLLAVLSFLFVPAGVGVMAHAERLRAEWLPIGAALVASTAVGLVVTALVFQAVAARMDRRGDR